MRKQHKNWYLGNNNAVMSVVNFGIVSGFQSLQFRCSRHHRERLLRWAGVKGTHRIGRRANRPPPCSLLATVKRDIGSPVACVVCLAISPAVCRLFLLASPCLGATPINTKNLMDRISICETLAKWNEIDPFLKRMMTGDEKWVTYDNIVRKPSWSKCGEAAQPGLMTRKVLLRI
ncbi:uncharacterized protein TNCV_3018521 [Trichonephila clavipes]|nr:uncharacterized protein TNCV_3018521 [Trichonephila clavipes]